MASKMDNHLTPLEIKRLETIARNRAILAKLGVREAADAFRDAAKGAPIQRKRKEREVPEVAEEDKRRSDRVRNLPADVDTALDEEEEDEEHNADQPSTNGRKKRSSMKPAAVPTAPAPGSSKGMVADVEGMLHDYLGKLVLPTDGSGAMKAAVMARLRGANCAPPRYNKYSGIQEWVNAIALFVNWGGCQGYDNTLSDRGCIKWFAQPTQTRDSPVIQSLLADLTAREAHHAAGTDPTTTTPTAPPKTIVLFIREEGKPYVCCGTLRPVQCRDASPIEIEFVLESFELLLKTDVFQPFMA